ncbi:MAG: hypothetical protein GQ555_07080 [Desulfobacterales bacterium]|nr:hypothetical protein [Desulfobacterales bacterium]
MMQHRLLSFFAIFMLFFPFACSENTEPGTTTELHPVLKDVHVATVHMTDKPLIYEAVGTVWAGKIAGIFIDSKLTPLTIVASIILGIAAVYFNKFSNV